MWQVLSMLMAAVAAAAAQEPLCNPPECLYTGALNGDHAFKLGDSRLLLSWRAPQYLLVECAGAALDAPSPPRFVPELRVSRATFLRCEAPRRGWGAALVALGVAPPPRLDLLALTAAPLTRVHFTALPGLHDLRLFGADDATAQPELADDALQPLPELVALRLVNVRAHAAALPLRLQNLTLCDVAALPEGWGAARRDLVSLRLRDVEDAGGLGGAAGLRVLALEGRGTRVLWADALPRLENATLQNVSALPARLWAGSEALRSVAVLQSRAVTALPGGWLAGHARLAALRLQGLSLTSLPADVLRGAGALRLLHVVDCGVTSLPDDLLRDASDLREIVLDNNKLSVISPALLAAARRLERVSVAHNALTSLQWAGALDAPLTHLDARHNPLGDLCGERTDIEPNGMSPLRKLKSLRSLSLGGTGAVRVCGDWRLLLVRLGELDLSHNNITFLDADDLRWVRVASGGGAGDARVDLSHNPVRELQYSYVDFQEMRAALNATEQAGLYRDTRLELAGAPLRCDCVVYWLVLALRSPPRRPAPRLTLSGARCADGTPLPELRPERLECALGPAECPARCACAVRPAAPDETRAVCSAPSAELLQWRTPLHLTLEHAALRRVPRLAAPPRALRLAGNDIQALSLHDLSPQLQELDLSNNSLSSLQEEVTSALVSERGPRVLRLAGNPWRCDCDAAPLLAALRDHSDRVADYAAVRCADGRAARTVGAGEVCAGRTAVRGGLAALGVVVAAGAGAALLYARYRHLVKAFLHARCCRRDEDGDEATDERQFDVFVSYSHEDAVWTERTLVPRLEAGGWRVCVHVRDWVAGDWIPAQIARSVRASRRTLAVLSPAYMGSVWALAELRAALALSVRSSRPRLVLLLLQDVPAERLQAEPELQAYLATNTYLRADEPWFWNKLRLALPRRPLGPAPATAPVCLRLEPDPVTDSDLVTDTDIVTDTDTC